MGRAHAARDMCHEMARVVSVQIIELISDTFEKWRFFLFNSKFSIHFFLIRSINSINTFIFTFRHKKLLLRL